jgi:hypothetical protein
MLGNVSAHTPADSPSQTDADASACESPVSPRAHGMHCSANLLLLPTRRGSGRGSSSSSSSCRPSADTTQWLSANTGLWRLQLTSHDPNPFKLTKDNQPSQEERHTLWGATINSGRPMQPFRAPQPR